jgi:hypothetical protein
VLWERQVVALLLGYRLVERDRLEWFRGWSVEHFTVAVEA